MTFTQISRTDWQAIQQRLESETGVAVTTDFGSLTHEIHAAFLSGDITITWAYDEDASTLNAACTDKPGWCPQSTIDAQLTKLVEVTN